MGLKKYIVRGLGEFFDGLVISCQEELNGDWILVEKIEQPSRLFETFSIPVSEGLKIKTSKLTPYEEPNEDYLTDNPFGKYKSEGKIERDGVTILWGLYSRALTVNVKNLDRTILSKNVFEQDKILNTKNFLNEISCDDAYDIHDTIFDLMEVIDG